MLEKIVEETKKKFFFVELEEIELLEHLKNNFTEISKKKLTESEIQEQASEMLDSYCYNKLKKEIEDDNFQSLNRIIDNASIDEFKENITIIKEL